MKAILFISVFLLASCSANYHVQKAIKKGYRCDTVQDTFVINSIDSIPYVLRDSIAMGKGISPKRYNSALQALLTCLKHGFKQRIELQTKTRHY
jgi:hypothetical protein